jgi:hypothetical protein
MKILYSFSLLLISFYSCNNSASKQDVCYEDIFEFTGMITHRYELIIYSMDKLNSCFIKNNPDVVINSEVYVNSNRDDKWIKFMESVSEINSYGTVGKRTSKMQYDLENNSDSTIAEMKWEYFYNNKDLIKEIHYNKEFDSSTSRNKSWNSVSKNEIKLDSLGRVTSRIKYTSWNRNSWEIERKSFFNYSNFTEIEEYDDFHLDDNWKYIREKDDKGNIIKELTYIFKKDKWMLYSQREFICTNKKEKESYMYWSWFFEKLEDKYSKLYIYDKEERLSRIITTSEHFFSNNESELYTDTLKLAYYNNGLLKKIDEGRDIFIFEYSKNGFIKKFLWQSVFDKKISNTLMVNQSYTKN